MQTLGSAAAVAAVAQLADRIAAICDACASEAKGAQEEIQRLSEEAKAFRSVMASVERIATGNSSTLLASDATARLISSIAAFQPQLAKLVDKLNPGMGRIMMRKAGLRTLKWPFRGNDMALFIASLEVQKNTILLALNVAQKEIAELAEQNGHIEKLHIADGASFDAELDTQKPRCLQGTRVELLGMVQRWSEDPQGAGIFWLTGTAGTGKSTVARTIASEFATQGRLGASFFFSRGRGHASHAERFASTIAAQLSNSITSVKRHISAAISDDPEILYRSPRDQWAHLVVRPLRNAHPDVAPACRYFLVVDALDECDSQSGTDLDRQHDIRMILQFLSNLKESRGIELRVFLTSRREIQTYRGFGNTLDEAHSDVVLHDIEDATTHRDISRYLSHELDVFRQEYEIAQEWPPPQDIEVLSQRANNQFIYAATVCRFVRSCKIQPPENRLALLLERIRSSDSLGDELDRMYIQLLQLSVLGNADPRERAHPAKLFREIFGPSLLLYNALSPGSFARLIHVPEKAAVATFANLQSIADAPESGDMPITLHHNSIRDFVLDQHRCSDSAFWVDRRQGHATMAENCILTLATHLKKDICNLVHPGSLASEVDRRRIERGIPPHVRYACRYWVAHLNQGAVNDVGSARLHAFLRQHFLHWLKALSLLGWMPEALLMVQCLKNWSTENHGRNSHLSEFLNDAKLFILRNRPAIEAAPLQTYCSALVFSPRHSIVRQCCDPQGPAWVSLKPETQDNWGPALLSLKAHSNEVHSVAFSPNGKLVASASSDKTIRLWDVETGASRGTLEGHSSRVNAVAFSPDSRLVTSASSDDTVRVWDTETGASRGILNGHLSVVWAVAFSPDGKLIASASSDCTARLWDVERGITRGILEGHSYFVNAVAFSPDGKLVATTSADETVRLWDTELGVLRSTLDGPFHWLSAVAFSPDSKLVASASDNGTVSLWDAETGALLSALKGPFYWLSAVAFSPGIKLVASASDDKTVKLWDAETGAFHGALDGHLNRVNTVAFSLDGKLVASASSNGTLRLWDTEIRASTAFEGHSRPVHIVTFSPNGNLVATASEDCTVILWDAKTGASCATLNGHCLRINALAFSPDSKLVATASNDCTVILWDAKTGASRTTLEGHFFAVDAVAFSPDGKLVATASTDETIRLWETDTNHHFQTLLTNASVNGLRFSADGPCLETDQGSWDTNYLCSPIPTSGASSQSMALRTSAGRVYWGVHDVLWLPTDFQVTCAIARDNLLVFGHSSGRVTFMELDPLKIPLS